MMVNTMEEMSNDQLYISNLPSEICELPIIFTDAIKG